jgi:MarR family transcriptional regulator, organic hydroperoxide resistance regulator
MTTLAKATVTRRVRKTAPPGDRAITSRAELLVDGSDTEFRRLVHNMFVLMTRHEAIRANHGAGLGLSGPEYTCLVTLGYLQEAGSVNVKMLAEHLHVSGAFVTTTIGKLVKAGFVHKEADTSDRRCVSLWLTPRGRAVLEGHKPIQRKVNDVRFGCLSRQEFAQLSAMLEKLVDSAGQALALQSYLMRDAAAGGLEGGEPAQRRRK